MARFNRPKNPEAANEIETQQAAGNLSSTALTRSQILKIYLEIGGHATFSAVLK